METISNFSEEAIELLIKHVDTNYHEMSLEDFSNQYDVGSKIEDELLKRVAIREYLESHNLFLGFTENKTKVLFCRGF